MTKPYAKKKTAAPAPEPASKAKTEAARKRALQKKGDLRHVRAAVPKTAAAKAKAEEARALSGRQQRYLRGLGHHLDPIVQIGKEGITAGVVEATRVALLAHELVKVRVLQEAPVDRKEAGEELARRAGAALAQTLGRTLLLYKRHPHKPKIVLPR
jgi:RNA-binding protein